MLKMIGTQSNFKPHIQMNGRENLGVMYDIPFKFM